jgi:hypothetical protein
LGELHLRIAGDTSQGRAMETTEIVTGTLKGMGFFVECTLMVTRSETRPESAPAYIRCGIVDPLAFLPDGYYEAAFRAHTAFLHKANGGWHFGIPWPEFPGRQAARPKLA